MIKDASLIESSDWISNLHTRICTNIGNGLSDHCAAKRTRSHKTTNTACFNKERTSKNMENDWGAESDSPAALQHWEDAGIAASNGCRTKGNNARVQWLGRSEENAVAWNWHETEYLRRLKVIFEPGLHWSQGRTGNEERIMARLTASSVRFLLWYMLRHRRKLWIFRLSIHRFTVPSLVFMKFDWQTDKRPVLRWRHEAEQSRVLRTLCWGQNFARHQASHKVNRLMYLLLDTNLSMRCRCFLDHSQCR